MKQSNERSSGFRPDISAAIARRTAAPKVTRLGNREFWIYAVIGFSVWLNGALTFRLGGRAIFESGPWISLLAAIVIAVAVCLIYRSTMRWRKTGRTQAVSVAVVMLLPGLFGEVARQLVFSWATGLEPGSQPAFAATILFGNAALLAYALWHERQSPGEMK